MARTDLYAHGVGGRQDLPVPFELALWAAAVVLLVSFVALGVLWRDPRLRGDQAGRPVPRWLERSADHGATRWLLRLGGLIATGYVAAAALFGPDLATNPTAGVVYVLFWVGLVPASVLLGPVWRLVNPLRTLHLLLARAMRVPPERGLRPLPRRLGYWPAAAGLLAFLWLELVAPDRTTLPVIRTWFGLYAGLHLLAAAVYGSRWFDRGDAFEVYSGLLGRLAPVGRRADGRLVVRHPLHGLDGVAPAPGLVAVVGVLLGSTAYDGLSNAPSWVRFTQESSLSPTVTGTAGLLGMITVVLLTYTAATALAGRLGQGTRATLPGQFAHAVVPIALGYVVAHYFTLLLFEGQATVIRLSDPLGTGADLLGTGGRGVDFTILSATTIAVVQVSAVVTGHVLGVVASHDRAVRLFPRRQAIAGQGPLLVLMVGYTLGGLTLLFAT